MHPSAAVVRLMMRKGKQKLSIGTGFLFKRSDQWYIVTAWHNVTGRHTETFECLDMNLAVPDNIVVNIPRISTYGGRSDIFSGGWVTIPLEDEDKGLYFVSDSWPLMDVAAIPLDIDKEFETEGFVLGEPFVRRGKLTQVGVPDRSIPELTLFSMNDAEASSVALAAEIKARLDVTDELFVVGYPQGITDMYCQSIWKRATVASSPSLGWNRASKFLIDCASRPGMSGAPVLFYSSSGAVKMGNFTQHVTGPATFLHGIYVGRISGEIATQKNTEDFSLFQGQIGTVWKREAIEAVIDAGVYGVHSRDLPMSSDLIDKAIQLKWPSQSDSPEHAQKMLDKPGVYLPGMTQAVLEVLKGYASAAAVSKRILDFAKNLTSNS